jgi:hypothetical protein
VITSYRRARPLLESKPVLAADNVTIVALRASRLRSARRGVAAAGG